MFAATLAQRALALSFLAYWENDTPKERFSPISLMSAFNVARSGAIGFFFTLEASLLAASWAAISASATVLGLTSGRVYKNCLFDGWWWCIALREAASDPETRRATARVKL